MPMQFGLNLAIWPGTTRGPVR